MTSNLEQLESVIARTLADDNEVRQQAERLLLEVEAANPAGLIEGLLTLMQKSQTPTVRNSCAVLLRRRLLVNAESETMLYDTLPDDLQVMLRSQLLAAIVAEPIPFMKRQIADTVAELAKCVCYRRQEDDTEMWPELLPFLFHVCTQGETVMRHVGFAVLCKLAEHAPDVLEPRIAECVQVYASGLRDTDLAVRVQVTNTSIRHACSLIDDDDQVHSVLFQGFISNWMETLGTCLTNSCTLEATKVMESLIELAADFSSFFKPQLEPSSDLFLQIGQSGAVDPDVRKLALQWFVNVCVDKPVMARRSPSVVRNSLGVALSLMLAVEDDPQWLSTEMPILERDGLDDETLFDAGEAGLERIAGRVGRNKVVPLLFPILQQFVSNQDWRFRFVGVHGIGCIAELLEFEQIPTDLLVNFVSDPHPRVVFGALHSIGIMSCDFEEEFQTAYHATVVPALVRVLQGGPHPKLQAQAAQALFNFFEDGTEDLAEQYMPEILPILYRLIQTGTRAVVAASLTVVASMAGKDPKTFSRYYGDFMPLAKHVIVQSTRPELRALRARAMESATFIGMAMDRDVFRADAHQLMDHFLGIMRGEHLSPDDAAVQYLFNAWTRICTVLREEFVPYLPQVMPFVFQMASLPVDGLWRSLAEEAERSSIADGYGTSGVVLDARKLNESIEDKVSGLNMLGTFLGALAEGAHFVQFLPQTIEIVLPLLDSHISDEIRSICIACLPDVVKCSVAAASLGKMPEFESQALFALVCRRLADCLQNERDIMLLMKLVQALGSCVDEVGPKAAAQWINEDVLRLLTRSLIQILEKSVGRIMKRDKQKQQTEDLDEEALADLESYNDTERMLSFTVSECVGTMVRSLAERFLPAFDTLLPLLLDMAGAAAPLAAQTSAVFIFDDIVEHCGPHSVVYFPHFLPCFFRFVQDPRHEVRQAAAYGIGSCAKQTGAHFSPHAADAARLLVSACLAPNARKKRHSSATDNVVSALAKIIKYQPSAVDVRPLVTVFLSSLPLVEDLDESMSVYSVLVELMESNSPFLLGDQMQNLPKITSVLLAAHDSDYLDEELNNRIGVLIQTLGNMPPGVLDQLASLLTADERAALSDKLSRRFAS